jgi:hypothetical protein
VATRIKSGVFKGAVLAIATDDRADWVKGLARLTTEAGLEPTQAPP